LSVCLQAGLLEAVTKVLKFGTETIELDLVVICEIAVLYCYSLDVCTTKCWWL